MSKVLALDFDGVLWDSAGECFQTGWRAYQELTGRDLSGPEYEKGFLLGRPLARTGHDFYLLLHNLEQNPEMDLTQMELADFASQRVSQGEQAARFDKIFYRLRAHFRDSEPKMWVSWQNPYFDVLKIVDTWEESFAGMALATTKDTQSARNLLALTGREWPIFGKEFSEHKADQITGISQHFKVETKDILFVDDLLENLKQVEPTKVKTALAAWGYNLPASQVEAREDGHQVVSVPEFDQLIQDFLDDKI